MAFVPAGCGRLVRGVLALGLLVIPPVSASAPPQGLAPHALSGGPARMLEQPNVLVVVLDDVGVDLVGAYGEGPDPACTPALDALAAGGVLFRNAYTNPVCSPTRAQILTGRHGFRTGIGAALFPSPFDMGLSLDEVTLPEALPFHASAAIGKWHLGNVGDPYVSVRLHPLASGFDRHAGTLFNLNVGALDCGPCPPCPTPHNYFTWVKTVDGVQECASTYATTDTANETIAAVQELSEPWLVYACFHAAHSPAHVPPAALCPPGRGCHCPLDGTASQAERYRAMVEALDVELGRVLAAVQARDPEAWILVIGDNGSSPGAAVPSAAGCFEPWRSKATLYEGGVRVPFVVSGPGVVPGTIDALVQATDLFATVMELARLPWAPEDSVSLVPYLRGDPTPRRATVYVEFFEPNGPGPYTRQEQAIRSPDFKLIRRRLANGTRTEQLFDLRVDPCETLDLWPPAPGTEAEGFYQLLLQELGAIDAPSV